MLEIVKTKKEAVEIVGRAEGHFSGSSIEQVRAEVLSHQSGIPIHAVVVPKGANTGYLTISRGEGHSECVLSFDLIDRMKALELSYNDVIYVVSGFVIETEIEYGYYDSVDARVVVNAMLIAKT